MILVLEVLEFENDVIRAWQHAHNVSDEPTRAQLRDWALHIILDRVEAELGTHLTHEFPVV